MKVLIGTTKNGIDVFAGEEIYKALKAHVSVNIDHVSEAIGKIVYDGQLYIGGVNLEKIVGKDEFNPKDTSYITIGICRDLFDNVPTLFTAFYGILATEYKKWDSNGNYEIGE